MNIEIWDNSLEVKKVRKNYQSMTTEDSEMFNLEAVHIIIKAII